MTDVTNAETVLGGWSGGAVPDDPKDDYLATLARASGADYIVSRDPHLMEARPGEWTGVVLTPRQFDGLLEDNDP